MNDMAENILFSDIHKNEIIVGDDGRLYFIDRDRYGLDFLTGIFLLVLIGIPITPWAVVQIFSSAVRLVGLGGETILVDNGSISGLNIFISISFFVFVWLVWKKLCLPHRKRLGLPYKEVNLSYRSDGKNLFFVDKNGIESVECPLSEVKTQIIYSRGVRYASDHRVFSLFTGKRSIPIGDVRSPSDVLKLKKVQEDLKQYGFIADTNEYKTIS